MNEKLVDDRELRKLEIELVDPARPPERRTIAKLPFETKESDGVLSKAFQGVKEGLETLNRRASHRRAPQAYPFEIYMRNLITDEVTPSIIIFVNTEDAAQEFLEVCEKGFERECKARIFEIYQAMVNQADELGVDLFRRIPEDDWRFICGVHPLFNYTWNEERKREFMETARATIRKYLREGKLSSKDFGTNRSLSRKKSDKTPFVQTPKKKAKPQRDSGHAKRVASDHAQRKVQHKLKKETD